MTETVTKKSYIQRLTETIVSADDRTKKSPAAMARHINFHMAPPEPSPARVWVVEHERGLQGGRPATVHPTAEAARKKAQWIASREITWEWVSKDDNFGGFWVGNYKYGSTIWITEVEVQA